jgi:hypothetical protein
MPMRLTPVLVERTLRQFEAQPIPDNHPSMPELSKLFGDHTFFLDRNGLNIVEPVTADDAETPACQVVKLASWNDANRTSLAAHEPEPTDIVIALGTDSQDSLH